MASSRQLAVPDQANRTGDHHGLAGGQRQGLFTKYNSYFKDDQLVSERLFGGVCTCPDGQQYEVADKDNCQTPLAFSCKGGVPGKCAEGGINPDLAQMRVICAPVVSKGFYDDDDDDDDDDDRRSFRHRGKPGPHLSFGPPPAKPKPLLHGSQALAWLAGLLVANLLLVAVGLIVCIWLCWRRPTRAREVRLETGAAGDIEIAMLGADALAESPQCKRDSSTASGSSSGRRSQRRPSHPSTNLTNDALSPAHSPVQQPARQDPDMFALGERHGNLAGFADRQNSEMNSSSFMETLSMLTEGIFKDSKLAGIIKLGVYEHWVIDASDIQIDNRFGGKGSFGEVQHAFMYGGTEVALKTAIHVDRDNQQGVTALANEVRLLRRIRHSNIVMFHGVMLESNLRGIAMVLEWVEGNNLDRYLRPRTLVVENGVEKEKVSSSVRLAVQSSCKLLEDVSRGMQYLHAQSPVILHRDLKPANILVEMITEPPRAKIADFGLSVLVKGAGQMGRAGTAAYMAPEVRRGELYSRGADVYSFGGVALFVLTGKNPDSELVKLSLEGDATSVGVFDWSKQSNQKAAISQICQLSLRERPEGRPDFGTALGILSSGTDGSSPKDGHRGSSKE